MAPEFNCAVSFKVVFQSTVVSQVNQLFLIGKVQLYSHQVHVEGISDPIELLSYVVAWWKLVLEPLTKICQVLNDDICVNIFPPRCDKLMQLLKHLNLSPASTTYPHVQLELERCNLVKHVKDHLVGALE